jgi:hypothetical protein
MRGAFSLFIIAKARQIYLELLFPEKAFILYAQAKGAFFASLPNMAPGI